MAHLDDSMDESALLKRLRRGDPAAMSELLTAHQGRLYNICLRLVGNPEDAADLTQETLLKAIRHIDRFRGAAQIATWLTRIATNEAITHLRRRRLRYTASLDAEPASNGRAGGAGDERQGRPLAGNLSDHREPSPEQRVQQMEAHEQLQAALGLLDADFRAVLVLRDIDQMSYQQIAEVLEVPLGTVRSRLFRARLALRQHLSETETETPKARAGAGGT